MNIQSNINVANFISRYGAIIMHAIFQRFIRPAVGRIGFRGEAFHTIDLKSRHPVCEKRTSSRAAAHEMANTYIHAYQEVVSSR